MYTSVSLGFKRPPTWQLALPVCIAPKRSNVGTILQGLQLQVLRQEAVYCITAQLLYPQDMQSLSSNMYPTCRSVDLDLGLLYHASLLSPAMPAV